QGDAWEAMRKALEGFLARVSRHPAQIDSEAGRECSLWELTRTELPESGRHLIGSALDAAACLGRRPAALHLALGQEARDPRFAAEPMTTAYLEARHESMRHSWNEVVRLLQQGSLTGIPSQQETAELLAQERSVLAVFQSLLEVNQSGQGGRR